MVKLYVEGGGTTNALRAACRQGFTSFLDNAGLSKKPRVVACGGRKEAYDDYCTAVKNGEDAVLLVDSETPVLPKYQEGVSGDWKPWQHLKNRVGDGWDKPPLAADVDCHLMTQCMENWFLADRIVLKKFFGQGFKEGHLPPVTSPVEAIDKSVVYDGLAKATKDCKTKSPYGKAEHSFKLLAQIDPAKVAEASPWGRRFIELLKVKMES